MDTRQISLFSLKKLQKHFHSVLLTLIILLAVILRFSFLSHYPVSLYWDEVSEGYNSYSILHTGKDEYGRSLPLFFASFEDDKMPFYIYGSTIPIALFGLNEFSVRFVSALAGVLTVVFTYFFVLELGEVTTKKKNYTSVALLAAFFLTISPWHIQFSRAGFEATVALCFIVSGSYFLLKSTTKRVLYCYLGMILLGMSLLTYRSSLLFVPGLIMVIILIFRKHFLAMKRFHVILSFLIFLLFALPLILKILGPGDVRAQEVSIFNNDNPQIAVLSQKQQRAGSTLLSKIIYNRRIGYAEVFAENYISHFSLQFLFLSGDGNGRHSLGNMGLLYLWELPFIIIGIYFLFRTDRKIAFFIISWILLSPIAASFSTPAPHALRSLCMLPMPDVVAAFGTVFLYSQISNRYRGISVGAFFLLLGISFFLFLQKYTFHNGVSASSDWADGYKQMIEKVDSLQSNYERVVVTGHFWQPYMFFLFYNKVDPAYYQRAGNNTAFGKYLFGGTEWDKRVNRPELNNVNLVSFAHTQNALFVLSPSEYHSHQSELKKLTLIKNHNGDEMFYITQLK